MLTRAGSQLEVSSSRLAGHQAKPVGYFRTLLAVNTVTPERFSPSPKQVHLLSVSRDGLATGTGPRGDTHGASLGRQRCLQGKDAPGELALPKCPACSEGSPTSASSEHS